MKKFLVHTKKAKKGICLLGGLLVFMFSCNAPSGQESRSKPYARVYQAGQHEIRVPLDTKARLHVRVTVYSPKRIRANVLVLPGWKFHRHRWLKETQLRRLAEARGYRLICPEMYTSLYASRYYPETRMKWNPIPGLVWIRDQMIPFFQKKGIFLKEQTNFLLGLSTGARGVALIGLEMPRLFRAAAALSGDYDQSRMPADKLMAAVYGSYQKFPVRWNKVDNPQSRVREWKLPIYLAHGRNDRVVPFSQTERFYRSLRQTHPALSIKFSSPKAGHNFRFWNSELPAIADFFEKFKE